MRISRYLLRGSMVIMLIVAVLATIGFFSDNSIFYMLSSWFLLAGFVSLLLVLRHGYRRVLTQTSTVLEGLSRYDDALGKGFKRLGGQLEQLELGSTRLDERTQHLAEGDKRLEARLVKQENNIRETVAKEIEKVQAQQKSHEGESLAISRSMNYDPEAHRNKALITFSYDDGRRNNYEVALPVQEKYAISASLAMKATGALGPCYWKEYMNPREIADANARGVDIASHGLMHRRKFTEMDDEELDYELEQSKKILESLISKDNAVEALCVPFSASNVEIREKAAKTYSFIRGFGRRLNDPFSDDPYVASYGFKKDTTFDEAKTIIDRAVREKKWVVLMFHGVVDAASAKRTYDISKSLLERILDYVNSIGEEHILPVNFADVVKLRQDKHRTKFYKPTIENRGAYKLAESPGFLITYHKNEKPTDKVGISFGGLPSKRTSTGFGSSFILKQGFDHIFVAQQEGSQYQELSVEDFVQAVEPYIIGKNVFTYGSSLGAYAALYYGGSIDAAIISSAPKNSAHPYMLKKRFSQIDFKHKTKLEDVPKSLRQPIVLFDPHRSEDKKIIQNWIKPAYPNARFLEFPFAGHTVLNTMQKSGVLKPFVTSYIDNGEIIPVALQQEGSYIWHAEKGRKLWSESRVTESKEQFKISLEIAHNNEAAAGLVRVYLSENQPYLAQELVEKHLKETGGYKGIPLSLRQRIKKHLTSN